MLPGQRWPAASRAAAVLVDIGSGQRLAGGGIDHCYRVVPRAAGSAISHVAVVPVERHDATRLQDARRIDRQAGRVQVRVVR